MLGDPNVEKTVAVLFGGRSSEFEISLRSAVFVLKNIPEKYRVIPVGINRSGAYYSLEGTFYSHQFSQIVPEDLGLICEGKLPRLFQKHRVVPSLLLPYRREVLHAVGEGPMRLLNLEAGTIFPVLHGPNGEDGRLQGVCELAEIPYVGCDMRASVIGIDKDLQKRLARDAGVPVAKYEVVSLEGFQHDAEPFLKAIEKNIGFPCFVKPNALGSAVGVNRAKNLAELKTYLQQALAFDTKALVEEPMEGTEVECAFLGTRDAPRITIAGEVAPKDFYSYEEKYAAESEAAVYIPARLDPKRMAQLQAHARTIAVTFSLDGVSRIDFWNCTKSNRFVFNEVNTLPGLTSISQFPKLWEHEGVVGTQWIDEIITRAQTRAALWHKLQFGIRASET